MVDKSPCERIRIIAIDRSGSKVCWGCPSTPGGSYSSRMAAAAAGSARVTTSLRKPCATKVLPHFCSIS